jgi:HNH endonuclease
METSVARESAIKLLATGNFSNWSIETLTTWLECDCRCAYCGHDMLQNRDIAYFFSHSDHILPQCKHPQLGDAPSNRVLSCKACNTMKRDWDPNSKGEVVIEPTRNQLTSEERLRFIARTREWLGPLRARNEKQFNIEKEAIEKCLPKPSATLGAAN